MFVERSGFVGDDHKSSISASGLFLYDVALLWVAGFLVEVFADAQKSAFQQDPANKDKFITTGLWAWQQHPNDLGEILLWIGMAVVAIPVHTGGLWITLVSPLFVIFLLTKVSGIPLFQAASKRRWGDDPAYQDHRRRTPLLILRPPSRV